MRSAQINRFEWLKAVMQNADLNATAKALASAMAVQFANDETGQLNPSVATLADYLKASKDSIKRAVKALVDGGWLGRTEGRGRGNRTVYRLLSPGRIVALPARKKGAEQAPEKGRNAAPSPEKKGADLRGKGGNAAPSYIEQSLEQNRAAVEPWRSHRFSGNVWDGPAYIPEGDTNRLYPWGRWALDRLGLPLSALPIKLNGGKKAGAVLALPWSQPPKNEAQEIEARAYFTDLLEVEGARHAAQ